MLVSKIRDIKYVIVNTEEDALLLENNLIKRDKPHYKVLLKDDKTYRSICGTSEIYLGSPAVAAASAVMGYICAPEDVK